MMAADTSAECARDGALCSGCLVSGRRLAELSLAPHREYYYRILSDKQISTQDWSPMLCWECEALLRRSVDFCQRVGSSYRLLNTYSDQNLRECLLGDISRPPRLTTQKISSVDIYSPSVVMKIEIEADKLEAAHPEPATVEKVEKVEDVERPLVKCEQVDLGLDELIKKETELSESDDDDCRLPSDESDDLEELESEIKAFIEKDRNKGAKKVESEKVESKKEKKKRKLMGDKENKARKVIKNLKKNKKRLAPVQRVKKPSEPLKIRTIEMSYEEMLSERARDAVRESYARAEFKCADCLLGFCYNKSYEDHMDTKHNPNTGEYSCPICKTIIASVESFTTHYKRHMRRYECVACGKRTMDRKVMMQHYETTHENGGKEYKCHCGQVSHSMDAHRYHKDTHKARVECAECDKTFSHRAGLMNHRLTVHKLNNMFPCSLCDKVFRWKASLKKHLERHERKFCPPDNAPYCEPCGVSFSSVCTYQRHMKNSLKHVTENELKFICDDCNRKFANKTKLRDHIEEKHLHKSYQCHICQKPSKNRVCLDQHIRNVHKGRPNNKMCHHCGKGFPTKVQLDSHIRSHTGERPFICEYCPTTFSQQSNLYKHNRQVHLNIKAKRYPPVCRKRNKKEEGPDAQASNLNVHAHADLYHLVM